MRFIKNVDSEELFFFKKKIYFLSLCLHRLVEIIEHIRIVLHTNTNADVEQHLYIYNNLTSIPSRVG